MKRKCSHLQFTYEYDDFLSQTIREEKMFTHYNLHMECYYLYGCATFIDHIVDHLSNTSESHMQ